ncbi:hypothetical protein KC723_01010 [Candidatus Kaiserbacteria bacterium]|nr:hypothetical protein [Candidatus Kaiserbacteria bacterium]
METTLIVNPGSTSKKYALYAEDRLLLSFRYEVNGQDYYLSIDNNSALVKESKISKEVFDFACHDVFDRIEDSEEITDTKIAIVGIRVVAPGTAFQKHVVIDEDYISKLKSKEPAAPLHIPHIVKEINQLKEVLPKAVLVATSDSAFHKTMPAESHTYSIPVQDAKEFDIYRFGYHGLSVQSITRRVEKVAGENPSRLVVAHIGGGASLTAVKNGLSFDTTMGFSPASGLTMVSRSGEIDPGAVVEIMRVKQLNHRGIHTYLQTQGGLVGMTGESDMRQVLERRASGDEVAVKAIDHYRYIFRKNLGALVAGMGGVEVVVLTATAVVRNPYLRQLLMSDMEELGVFIDKEKNKSLVNAEGVISTADSRVKVVVMKTDEMGEMYRTTREVIKNGSS